MTVQAAVSIINDTLSRLSVYVESDETVRDNVYNVLMQCNLRLMALVPKSLPESFSADHENCTFGSDATCSKRVDGEGEPVNTDN